MKKSAMASIIAIAAALACLLGLAGCEENSVDAMTAGELSATGICSGTISSYTGMEMSKKLNEGNGKYVNLYVENNGSNSVVATINGQNKRTFNAGETGYVYLEVTQSLLGLDREYEFKVVPGSNGGSIDIYYEIVQDIRCYSENAGR